MDSYVDLLQSQGGSHGDDRQGQFRSRAGDRRPVTAHGGFYLGSIGGTGGAPGPGAHHRGAEESCRCLCVNHWAIRNRTKY
ncbi:MAG: hypothetical protein MZV63_12190, partial [Marinilabiliales bacterium]|nr:hypothetical protein [Marinilabiliales bacterium]